MPVMVTGAHDRIRDALEGIQTPVLAAVWGGARDALAVHLAATPNRSEVRNQILSSLAKAGVTRVSIRFHTARELTAPRSLERLAARFAGGEVVFDPTGAITRANTLIAASRAARASLGEVLGGIFFAPRLRALYFSLDSKRLSGSEKVKVGQLAEIEQQIRTALSDQFAGRISECPSVRVGFGVPHAEIVPVDQRSVVPWTARVVRTAKKIWKPIAVATLFGFGANAAVAGEEPAVAPTNVKVTGAVVDVDGDAGYFFNGALTAPLGHSWGVQVEVGAASADGTGFLGAGGHIFHRDPSSHLLGLFAAYSTEDQFDLEAARLGAEAEIYLRQITLIAKVGYQFSDSAAVEGTFGEVELRWYVSDNFAFSAGGSFEENTTLGHLGAEWLPGIAALPGLAFRVDGVMGEDDYDSLLGGITYYFGADASLKDRHRKQDPDSALFSLFQSVEQERAKLCLQYSC